jgi:hypothetical protein
MAHMNANYRSPTFTAVSPTDSALVPIYDFGEIRGWPEEVACDNMEPWKDGYPFWSKPHEAFLENHFSGYFDDGLITAPWVSAR